MPGIATLAERFQRHAVEAHVHLDADEIDLDRFGRQSREFDFEPQRRGHRKGSRLDPEAHPATAAETRFTGSGPQIAARIE